MKLNKFFAPIIVFSYNRPFHLERVLDSLAKNPESKYSDLIIFQDGPKTSKDEFLICKIEKLVKKYSNFNTITFKKSYKNLGLENSITRGVTEIVDDFKKVIVLEDDLVVSKFFLNYMNSGLNLYSKDEQVASVHGYTYPSNKKYPETFFLRGADCWGWGTWERSWAIYESDGTLLLSKLNNIKDLSQYNFDNMANYSEMLLNSISNKISSWAIKWYTSTFLADRYTLYPGRSLVENVGLDGSGRHSSKNNSLREKVENNFVSVQRIAIEDNKSARKIFYSSFKKQKSINNKILTLLFKK